MRLSGHLLSCWTIWIMDADGKRLKQVTNHPATDMYPEWASY